MGSLLSSGGMRCESVDFVNTPTGSVRGGDARGHELLEVALAGGGGEAKDHGGVFDGVDWAAV